VLRLQGSGLCDLKPDRCVASDQIDSYLEPDGRSGITFPSMCPLVEQLRLLANLNMGCYLTFLKDMRAMYSLANQN
jgi:hypothetical protein